MSENGKTAELVFIEIDQIEFGTRQRETYTNVEKLAASISQHGLIQPIAVSLSPHGSERPYKLLAGGRRTKALEFLRSRGKSMQVPARLYPERLTLSEAREIELAENLEREDLTWPERVKATTEIHNLKTSEYGVRDAASPKAINPILGAPIGWSYADTAVYLGVGKETVRTALILSEAINKVPELAKLPTMSDAQKAMRKATRAAETSVMVREAEARRAETPLDIQRGKLANTYIVGDFFMRAPHMTAESFNIVEIDPPYGIDLHNLRKLEGKQDTTLDETYQEIRAEDYPGFLDRLFKEVYRVMAPESWLICWFGPDPWYNVVRDSIRKAGLTLNTIPLIWVKTRGQTMHPDQALASTYEMAFYARKGQAQIQRQGRFNTFIFPGVPPVEGRKIHPTERPIEMIQDVLSTFSLGPHLLVPFAGSGNTLLAGANLGMSVVGYDISPTYVTEYKRRVFEGEPGKYRSYLEGS